MAYYYPGVMTSVSLHLLPSNVCVFTWNWEPVGTALCDLTSRPNLLKKPYYPRTVRGDNTCGATCMRLLKTLFYYTVRGDNKRAGMTCMRLFYYKGAEARRQTKGTCRNSMHTSRSVLALVNARQHTWFPSRYVHVSPHSPTHPQYMSSWPVEHTIHLMQAPIKTWNFERACYVVCRNPNGGVIGRCGAKVRGRSRPSDLETAFAPRCSPAGAQVRSTGGAASAARGPPPSCLALEVRCSAVRRS